MDIARPRSPSADLSPRASVHLDALRGLAALAVVAFHARLLFFAARPQIEPGLATPAADLLYLATGFGPQAVLAFFVLSGFLIARVVQRDGLGSARAIGGYAIARLSRLYVVLLPALILGVAWDIAGLQLFPNADVYRGALANQLFAIDVAARLTPASILGTTAFLQAIAVPPPGSSEQFWSLAYEFWCYALFPLFYLALQPTSRLWLRIVALAAAAAIVVAVGRDVFAYFGCWLLGAAVAVLPAAAWSIVRRHARILIAAGLAGSVAALYLIKRQAWPMPVGGFGLALTLAVLIAGIAGLQRPLPSNAIWQGYSAAASWLAQRSFSLYAVHVALLVFLRAWAGNALWQPSWSGMALWLGLVVICLAYAELVWWLAERHTPAVRRWLSRRFTSAPARTAPPPLHSTR